MHLTRLIVPSAVAATLLAGASTSALGQSPSSGAFVATLGRDTVAVESYTFSGDRLAGQSVARYPRATIRSYAVTFGPDDRVERVRLEIAPRAGGTATTVDYTYGADSVVAEIRRDTLSRRLAVATGGGRPLPFFEDVFALWEVAVARQMASSADSARFGMVAGSRVLPIEFRRTGPSSAEFSADEWGTVKADLGPDGGFRELDMSGTTTKFRVERVSSVDVEGTASAWASRPQPGRLSPRDTARAEIGPAHVAVDYSRPSMRGRKVFGGIVPFGEVWRTGADAATQLITDHDLVIGNQPVPAGSYSLWAIPQRDGWTLIINRQHGQWGTEYDPDQDLVRVPLTVTRSDRPVERFTVTVAGGEAGEGSIAFAWERTRATVEVMVKEKP